MPNEIFCFEVLEITQRPPLLFRVPNASKAVKLQWHRRPCAKMAVVVIQHL